MLDRQITDEFNNSVLDKGELVSKMNTPATEIQIDKLKSVYSFPEIFHDLLRFSNGMELFNYKDLDGYNFYTVDKLIKENKELINTYEEKWTEEILVFCEILGEGNYIAVNLATGKFWTDFMKLILTNGQ